MAEVLPEECLSHVISFISPLDACRSSIVSALFRDAADSDLVWEKFLQSDYREIISRSVFPVEFCSKKDLFRKLSSARFSSTEVKRKETWGTSAHVIKYLVPSLLGVAGIKSQGKNQNDLFSVYPLQVWCFIASTCVCWSAIGMIKLLKEISSLKALDHIALGSGVISVISLGSILFLPEASLAVFIALSFLAGFVAILCV